jgi:hypothetical protein
MMLTTSVAELHNFYAAPAPGKKFDAAPAPTHYILVPSQLFENTQKLK